MDSIELLLKRCGVHPQWHSLLTDSLACVEAKYLQQLLDQEGWLPGSAQIFSAFRRNLEGVRYILIGESPYPRKQSANGVAFYDAAVAELWSEQGLSKAVNRATSMRNIIKTALLAENRLQKDVHGKLSQQAIAALDKSDMIQTMPELIANLQQAGFLLLNATLVLHPRRKPAQESIYWQGFVERLLTLIAQCGSGRITLLLWGKVARSLQTMAATAAYEQLACEHPYNISFIDNPDMRQLFSKIRLLQKPAIR